MPDVPYKTANGETRYRHITSGQAKILRDQKWERTVAHAKRRREAQVVIIEEVEDYSILSCSHCKEVFRPPNTATQLYVHVANFHPNK